MSIYEDDEEIDPRALEQRRAMGLNTRIKDDEAVDEAVTKTIEKSKELAEKSKAVGASAFGKIKGLFGKTKKSEVVQQPVAPIERNAVEEIPHVEDTIVEQAIEVVPEVAVSIEEPVDTLSVNQQIETPEDLTSEIHHSEDILAVKPSIVRTIDTTSIPAPPESFFGNAPITVDWDDEPEQPEVTDAVAVDVPATVSISVPEPVLIAPEEPQNEPITQDIEEHPDVPLKKQRSGLKTFALLTAVSIVGLGAGLGYWHFSHTSNREYIDTNYVDHPAQPEVNTPNPVALAPIEDKVVPKPVPVPEKPAIEQDLQKVEETAPKVVKDDPKPEPKHEGEKAPTPKAASKRQEQPQQPKAKPKREPNAEPKNDWQEKANNDLDKWSKQL